MLTLAWLGFNYNWGRGGRGNPCHTYSACTRRIVRHSHPPNDQRLLIKVSHFQFCLFWLQKTKPRSSPRNRKRSHYLPSRSYARTSGASRPPVQSGWTRPEGRRSCPPSSAWPPWPRWRPWRTCTGTPAARALQVLWVAINVSIFPSFFFFIIFLVHNKLLTECQYIPSLHQYQHMNTYMHADTIHIQKLKQ